MHNSLLPCSVTVQQHRRLSAILLTIDSGKQPSEERLEEFVVANAVQDPGGILFFAEIDPALAP